MRGLKRGAFRIDGRRLDFLRTSDLEVNRRKEAVGSLFRRRRRGECELGIGGRDRTRRDVHGRDGLVPFMLCHDDVSNSIRIVAVLKVLDADDSKREATGQGWLLS